MGPIEKKKEYNPLPDSAYWSRFHKSSAASASPHTPPSQDFPGYGNTANAPLPTSMSHPEAAQDGSRVISHNSGSGASWDTTLVGFPRLGTCSTVRAHCFTKSFTDLAHDRHNFCQ